MPPLSPILVTNGVEEEVPLAYGGTFSYLGLNGEDFSQIERSLIVEEKLRAPVERGQKAGVLQYRLNGEILGEVEVLTDSSVKNAGFFDSLKKSAWAFLI